MAWVGEEDKQGKDEGQQLSEQERLSTQFVDRLSKRDCEIKQPSRDWNDVKAVDFREDKEKIEYVRSMFTSVDPALRDTLEATQLKCLNAMSIAEAGKKIHGQLSRCIKKRLEKDTKPDSKPDDEEEQVKKFVTTIEESFNFKFKASELLIQGYASREHLEKTHFWNGRCDAIGVKKDGTVIVVDWTCCEKVDNFWNTAKFSQKLYQAMVYRWIIKALWEYYNENDDLEVDILIVPIPPNNGSDPRICIDLKCKELEENGFFQKFTWTAQEPRGGGNSLRREQETDKVKTENSRDRSMTEKELRDLLTTVLFIIALFRRPFCLSDFSQEGPPDTKCDSLVKKHSPQLQSMPETVSTIEEESAAKVDSGPSSCDENNQKLQSLPATVSTIEEQSAAKADSGRISCDESNQKLPENTRTDVKDVS